jgi:hypothetical protein
MDMKSLSGLSEEERAEVLQRVIREMDEDPRARDRVSLGFSDPPAPRRDLPSNLPLRPATEYLFWFDVGGPGQGSITDQPSRLPTEKLPADAIITVTLLGFEEELEVYPGQDVGRLRLRAAGRPGVEQSPKALRVDPTSARLFFPVRTPSHEGTFRLRCTLQHQNTLLQSWLVRAEVRSVPQKTPNALHATQDFVYSRVLEPSLLHRLPSPELTLMLNGTESTSHLFVIGDDTREALSFDPLELKKLVELGRDRLAEATWGKPRPWNGGDKCLYGQDLQPERLRKDLTRLAKVGWSFYTVLSGRLPANRLDTLEALFARPTSLQLALKRTPQAVFPLALVYDYKIDVEFPDEDFQLCPDFLAALEQGVPLETVTCFLEGCPHRGRRGPSNTICPSGFWGFRHELGLTVSAPNQLESPTHIPYEAPWHAAVGLSTDERLTHREAHIETLKNELTAIHWDCRETRDGVLEMLGSSHPHLVYFYCMGGLTPEPERKPFIRVGAADEKYITRESLTTYSIRWKESRPLVFINGCYATAVDPEIALSLVAGFIENALASGVLGTEITVFEETARAFAEHCLRRLFAGDTIGRAVRDARRELLQQGSPLGLVYIPFVLPGLRFDQPPLPSTLQQAEPTPVPA